MSIWVNIAILLLLHVAAHAVAASMREPAREFYMSCNRVFAQIGAGVIAIVLISNWAAQ